MFVRNHKLVPLITDLDEFNVEIHFGGKHEKDLSFNEIKAMKPHTVHTHLACAGNRRNHLKRYFDDVKGASWKVGAMSNGEFTGVLVKDLLSKLGYKESDLKGKHLAV